MNEVSKKVINEIKKAIVGKDDVIRKIWMAIIADGHILLEDIPGVGKTTMALSFRNVLDLSYNRVQFTPDIVASDIIGFSMYDVASSEFIFKPGAVMCNIFLADEINRGSSRTQSALLEVMEEKQISIDSKKYLLPDPFVVIATQNPFGSFGTQRLPQSQLDRFMVQLSMGYPDSNSQVKILKDRLNEKPLETINKVLDADSLKRIKEEVKKIRVVDEVLVYIATLCEATREHPDVSVGISPRGVLHTLNMARANAYVSGRDYVIPEDVAEVFIDTNMHRIILDYKRNLSKEAHVEILASILEETKTPDEEK